MEPVKIIKWTSPDEAALIFTKDELIDLTKDLKKNMEANFTNMESHFLQAKKIHHYTSARRFSL